MRNCYNHPHGQTRCVTHATSCERRAGCEFMHHPRERDVKRRCEFMHRRGGWNERSWEKMVWGDQRTDQHLQDIIPWTWTDYCTDCCYLLVWTQTFIAVPVLLQNSFVLLNIVKLITVTPPSSITGNHCHLLANWHCTRPLLLRRARLAQHCTTLSTRRNFWFRALDWDLFRFDPILE